MSMTKDGKVAIIIYQYGGVTMDAFGSVKELIKYYITETSLAAGWNSQEQLDALREVKALLDETIDCVAAELAVELSINGGNT